MNSRAFKHLSSKKKVDIQRCSIQVQLVNQTNCQQGVLISRFSQSKRA